MTQWFGYIGAVALVCVGAALNAPIEPAEPPPPAPVVVAEPTPAAAPSMDPSAAAPAAAPQGG